MKATPENPIDRIAQLIKQKRKSAPQIRLSRQVKLVAIAPRIKPEKQAQLLRLARELEELGL